MCIHALGCHTLNFLIKAHPTLAYIYVHAEHVTVASYVANSKVQHHKIE